MNEQDKDMYSTYKVECVYCKAFKIVEQHRSAGYALGTLIPFDDANPTFATCHKCKRIKLKVVSVAEVIRPVTTTGFTKIPTE